MLLRVRFHGRGGQGIKTAGRILGTSLFLEGYEVQDAPRYGAERRGAPIFSYVRASESPIFERGVITRPDLVVVADDTLMLLPSAGVLEGVDEHTVILLESDRGASWWRERLGISRLGLVVVLPISESEASFRFVGVRCAGAAARLLGKVSRATLERAVAEEMGHLAPDVVELNIHEATRSFDFVSEHSGAVTPREEHLSEHVRPNWIDCPMDPIALAAPAISKPATSLQSATGLWRTQRPVLLPDRCHRCHWVCEAFCPDGVITHDQEGRPVIDLEHCKGCMICAEVCPFHALSSVPEHVAARAAEET